MRHRMKQKAAAFAAGILSCTILLGTSAGDCGMVFAMEQAEANVAMEASTEEPLTEAYEDALLGEATHGIVDALSTKDADESDPMLLLPEDVRQTLNSLDPDEVTSYVIMIDRILKNPDFQSMLQYDEVRDLIVTLIHNGLNMAQEDPVMTYKILTTLGVDKRMIAIFFMILQERAGNPEATEFLSEFMRSENGAKLINRILESFDDETILKLLDEFQSTLDGGGTALTTLIEAAPNAVPMTEETKTENQSGEAEAAAQVQQTE